MIKFFRKIRYDLMEKNKTGKYFKYVIREIILVVIGVLNFCESFFRRINNSILKSLTLKAICFLLFFFFIETYGQNNYPVPDETSTRLFYVQHSKNHNTYVYDARMDGKSINKKKPINQYRIVYTDGGIKKPLTAIQKDLAYGLETKPQGFNFYEMYLSGAKTLKLYLVLNSNGKPQVYVTINNHKLYLDRIFIKLKDGTTGLNVKAEYVLFEGRDFNTNEKITEKRVF